MGVNKLRKIVSIALLTTIILTGKISATTNEKPENEEMVFAVISDIQMGSLTERDSNKLKNALNIINREVPNSDALLVAGDLTSHGYASEYDSFNSVYNAYGNKSAKMLAVMGNHDYRNNDDLKVSQKRFEDATGNKIKSSEVIGGYHFIQVSTEGKTGNGDFSQDLINWVANEVNDAVKDDPNKPIFLTVHQHIKNTVYGSDEWGNSALYDVLKAYPQVITFSGHSHYPLNDERSIHQRDFTSVGTSSLSFTELESGKINGSVPPNAYNVSQGLIVRVKGDSVNIERLDFHNDEKIKENWVINLPAIKENFKYTDERSIGRTNPYFQGEAKVVATEVTEDYVTFTFDQAKHDDLVHSYKLEAINKETGVVEKSSLVFSEFYFGTKMPDKLSFDITMLKNNTEYELRIYAIESFGKISSNYLSTSIKTKNLVIDEKVQKPVAGIFDFDFLKGNLSDKSQSNLTGVVNGKLNIEYDPELKRETTKLNSDSYMMIPFNTELSNKVMEQFTLETVFKMNSIKNQAILTNTASRGVGIESKTDGTVEIWAHIAGAYKKLGVKLEKDKYYHLLASYNGSSLDLYLNGEKVQSIRVVGKLSHSGLNYVLGGKPTTATEASSLFDGNIALARLYSKGVNASEVKKLYSEFNNRRSLTEIDSLLNKIKYIENQLENKPQNLLPSQEKKYEELNEILLKGINLYSKRDIRKTEIEEYVQDVDNVFEKLMVINKKIELEGLITKASDLIKEKYTLESWNLLNKVLKESKDIISNEYVSKDEIDTGIFSLQSAIDGLVKKTESSIIETPSDNNTNVLPNTGGNSVSIVVGLGVILIIIGFSIFKKRNVSNLVSK